MQKSLIIGINLAITSIIIVGLKLVHNECITCMGVSRWKFSNKSNKTDIKD